YSCVYYFSRAFSLMILLKQSGSRLVSTVLLYQRTFSAEHLAMPIVHWLGRTCKIAHCSMWSIPRSAAWRTCQQTSMPPLILFYPIYSLQPRLGLAVVGAHFIKP